MTTKPAVYDGTAGTIYTDPVFGTKIKRITPQPGMPAGSYTTKYSTWQSWSKNGTYMAVGGPGGNLFLLQGTDPYTYIPRTGSIGQINLPQWNGFEEPTVWWLNTDDCKFLYINALGADGWVWKFQTVDICSGSDVVTDLTPQANSISTVVNNGYTAVRDGNGNTHDLRPAGFGGSGTGLHILPYVYNSPSNDDRYVVASLTGDNGDGNGSVGHGFCLFEMNFTAMTVTAKWCRWFYGNGGIGGPGDLYWSGFPVARSGQGATSAKGGYVYMTYNTGGTGKWQSITSLVRRGNVVTATIKAADWSATLGIVVGAEFTVDGVTADTSFNGKFIVAAKSGNTITYNQSGPDTTITGLSGGWCQVNGGPVRYDCQGYVDYNHFGVEVWTMAGTFLQQLDRSELHHDQFLFADGTEGDVKGAGNDLLSYRDLAMFRYGVSSHSPDGSLVNWVHAYRPYASYGPQFHVSGRANDLPGYLVYSTYTTTSSPDCSPQVALCSEITVATTDGSNTYYRIAHVQNVVNTRIGEYYSAEPHATPNRDLTKIMWNTTWRDTYAGNVDVYLVELP